MEEFGADKNALIQKLMLSKDAITHRVRSISKAQLEVIFTYSRHSTKWARKVEILFFGSKPQSDSMFRIGLCFHKIIFLTFNFPGLQMVAKASNSLYARPCTITRRVIVRCVTYCIR